MSETEFVLQRNRLRIPTNGTDGSFKVQRTVAGKTNGFQIAACGIILAEVHRTRDDCQVNRWTSTKVLAMCASNIVLA